MPRWPRAREGGRRRQRCGTAATAFDCRGMRIDPSRWRDGSSDRLRPRFSKIYSASILCPKRRRGRLFDFLLRPCVSWTFRAISMAGRHNYHAWPTCNAFARSTGKPCRRKCAAGEDGRPRPRCLGHGGHIRSGQQTPEGRARIVDAARSRWLAFWQAWRDAGRSTTAMARKSTHGPRKAEADTTSA
jgi:hypothetical protein